MVNALYYGLFASVLSSTYIVEVDHTADLSNLILGDQEFIQVGNFKAFLLESEDHPYHLLENSFIKNIELDIPVSINQKSYFLQENPHWNLDRIDQKTNVLDNRYLHRVSQGRNTVSYVVDTGIDITHPEFQGRAVWGINTVDNTNTDCNSHGTHVAGTIGSFTFGVAKQTTLIAVKVLGCQGGGSMSGVIRGLEYVMNDLFRRNRPAIVNMSLGGGHSDSLNRAVQALTSAGIHVVAAAGNENNDACMTSPANEPTAMTVGATTRNNEMAGFSNWGKCVDVLSPGTEILSTVPGGRTSVLQGTSMAAPAVAGVYALILAENPSFSPETMKKVIKTTCIKNVISRMKQDTENCFIQSVV
jgi:hypothetical protein